MVMKKLCQIIGLLALFGFASQAAISATYKYQDESGNTVYSQNPPENPNTPYEVLGVPSHARPGTSAAPASSSPATSATLQENNNANDTVNREQQEAEKIRKENCETAKKNLEIYTVYRRVRNDDGEVVRLDDEVRQQKIDEAKQAIRDFCD